MSDPALAVQKAYVARIKAQVTGVSSRVFDRVPANVVFPFIQIGEIQTVEDGAECIDAKEVFVTLHVWSRAIGAVETRTINSALEEALHEWIPDLDADGFTAIEHMHRDTRTLLDPDGLTSHGILNFRLLIDRN